MEDYLTFEEFERLQKKDEKPAKQSSNINYFGIVGKFFHAIWIVLKLIGFGMVRLFKRIYHGLIKLNEGMEKIRQSPMGKQLKEHHEQSQKNAPSFTLPKPQKSFDFGMGGLQNDFKGFRQKKNNKKSRNMWGI